MNAASILQPTKEEGGLGSIALGTYWARVFWRAPVECANLRSKDPLADLMCPIGWDLSWNYTHALESYLLGNNTDGSTYAVGVTAAQYS